MILFCVLLLVLVGITTIIYFCSRQDTPTQMDTEWKNYYNNRYKFSLAYPTQWELGQEPENNDGRTFIDSQNNISCLAYGFHNMVLNDQGDPQSLGEFVNGLLEKTDGKEMLEHNVQTIMAGVPAEELILQTDSEISQAVYILGKEIGYGFICYYPNMNARKSFAQNFQFMQQSFSIGEGDEMHNSTQCSDMLNGKVMPLQDSMVVEDEDYLDVTFMPRYNWDRVRLPGGVLQLEDEYGYRCHSMPADFEDMHIPSGVDENGQVTKVTWSCDLPYNDFVYIASSDSSSKTRLEQQGYNCVEDRCTSEDTQTSSVFLCWK